MGKSKISKWTQCQLNWAKENEIMDEEQMDYRTKLGRGITDEERKAEYQRFLDSLEEKERNDFLYAFGEGCA